MNSRLEYAVDSSTMPGWQSCFYRSGFSVTRLSGKCSFSVTRSRSSTSPQPSRNPVSLSLIPGGLSQYMLLFGKDNISSLLGSFVDLESNAEIAYIPLMSVSIRNRLVLLWKERWVRIIVYMVIWTMLPFLYTIQFYLVYANLSIEHNVPVAHTLTREFGYWYSWAVLSPAIFWFCRRYRIGFQQWFKHAAIHIVAALFFSIAHLIVYASFIWLYDLSIVQHAPPQPSPWTDTILRAIAVMNFNTRYLIYWILLFLHHAFFYYNRVKENQISSSQLETKLVEAKLDALKMQIHPHFLFNALHSVSSLMHKDVLAADTMISKLSDLLRMTLDRSNANEILLKEELEVLERYVDIEQIRYRNRLTVLYNIDPDALDAYVPNLILQPLVENAISHGISKRRGGQIVIAAKRDSECLLLSVADNGKGIPSSGRFQLRRGVGLSNTRERLRQLYSDNFTLAMISNEQSGFSVKLHIPYRTEISFVDKRETYGAN